LPLVTGLFLFAREIRFSCYRVSSGLLLCKSLMDNKKPCWPFGRAGLVFLRNLALGRSTCLPPEGDFRSQSPAYIRGTANRRTKVRPHAAEWLDGDLIGFSMGLSWLWLSFSNKNEYGF
jgi:hypothetical protein